MRKQEEAALSTDPPDLFRLQTDVPVLSGLRLCLTDVLFLTLRGGPRCRINRQHAFCRFLHMTNDPRTETNQFDRRRRSHASHKLTGLC